jgi:hypothetical protein
MQHPEKISQKHPPKSLAARSGFLLFCFCVLSFASAAHAVNVPGLYDVTVAVPNRTDAARDAAFGEALGAVAVRISGRRDAAAKLAGATSGARRYVQRYGYPDDRTLQVGFDSAGINKLLGDVGLPIWGSERPATLVWFSLDEPGGQRSWINAATSTPEREVLTKAAAARGIPLIWPAMDATDQSRIEGLLGQSFSPAQLRASGERYRADAVLVGRARRNSAGVLAVRWQLAFSEELAETVGFLDDGVNLAADNYARVFAAADGAVGELLVDVTGVKDVSAYASTLNYLERLMLIRSVAVEQIAGDTLRLRLGVRGDAATLRRAIALDSNLVPQDSAAGSPGSVSNPAVASTNRLSFRYQP